MNLQSRIATLKRFLGWTLIIFAAGLGWWFIPLPWWQYLFFLRVPILLGFVLIALPIMAIWVLPQILKNIFVLKGKGQIAIAMVGSAIAAGAIAVTAHAIIDNAPARFSLPPLCLSDVIDKWSHNPTGAPHLCLNAAPDWSYYVLAGALTVPITLAVTVLTRKELNAEAHEKITSNEPQTSQPKHPELNAEVDEDITPSAKLKNRTLEILLGLSGGVVLDSAFVFFFLWAKQSLDSSETSLFAPAIAALEGLFNWFNWIILLLVNTSSTAGYTDPQTGHLLQENINALVFFCTLFVVYMVILFTQKPNARPAREKHEVPALLYILLLISIATLLLGNLTFFFDYSRVSVLLFWVVIAGGTYWSLNVDHFFTLRDRPSPLDAPNDDTFADLLKERLDHQGNEKTVVIVCASGGGIQAAGWTTQVLMGLQKGIGPSFTKAIGLISAVSGGSVGAIHYLDHFKTGDNSSGDRGYPPDEQANSIFEGATVNSLDAVGWGFTYPDLWRIIALPFLSYLLDLISGIFGCQKISDRGIALETEWRGEMNKPNKTLVDWREEVQQGTIPLPVLNATLIETGSRLLLSPVNFPKDVDEKNEEEKNSFSFNRLYPGKTIDVVTAARLSATFPYVSPVARAKQDKDKKQATYHVADGGYFDNSGFVTGLEWLRNILNSPISSKIKRVVIIQINPFPRDNETTAETDKGNANSSSSNSSNTVKDKGNGFLMAILGPLKGLFNVRDRVLSTRNQAEIELLKESQCHGKEIKIEYVPIFFPSFEEFKEKEASSIYRRNGEYEPPLSWKLTPTQKQAIKIGWGLIEDKTIAEVRKKFDGSTD